MQSRSAYDVLSRQNVSRAFIQSMKRSGGLLRRAAYREMALLGKISRKLNEYPLVGSCRSGEMVSETPTWCHGQWHAAARVDGASLTQSFDTMTLKHAWHLSNHEAESPTEKDCNARPTVAETVGATTTSCKVCRKITQSSRAGLRARVGFYRLTRMPQQCGSNKAKYRDR